MANRNLSFQDKPADPRNYLPAQSGLVVAYFVPHNEGIEAGIITGPGFTSELTLVDLYEVDASIGSFANEDDARTWLKAMYDENDNFAKETEKVLGGTRERVEY